VPPTGGCHKCQDPESLVQQWYYSVFS